MVQKKDALGRTVETIQYSGTFHYAYPTQVTNLLGHSAQTNYGFWSGLPISTTDANSQTTTFQYDAMNRVSRRGRSEWGLGDGIIQRHLLQRPVPHQRDDLQEHRRHTLDQRYQLL